MSIFSSSKSRSYTPYQSAPDQYKTLMDQYYASLFDPQYYRYLLGDLLSGVQKQRAGLLKGMEQDLALRGLGSKSGLAGYERSKLDRAYISNVANAYLKAKQMEEERRRLGIQGLSQLHAGGGKQTGAGLGHSLLPELMGAAGSMGAGYLYGMAGNDKVPLGNTDIPQYLAGPQGINPTSYYGY